MCLTPAPSCHASHTGCKQKHGQLLRRETVTNSIQHNQNIKWTASSGMRRASLCSALYVMVQFVGAGVSFSGCCADSDLEVDGPGLGLNGLGGGAEHPKGPNGLSVKSQLPAKSLADRARRLFESDSRVVTSGAFMKRLTASSSQASFQNKLFVQAYGRNSYL